ncbi:MAG: hypothetical protein EOP04_07770 [Proteobacteria bacterium]|nr:MAG: hypothetical protein EOP04_07770 [Pseudomonadota bacterium]
MKITLEKNQLGFFLTMTSFLGTAATLAAQSPNYPESVVPRTLAVGADLKDGKIRMKCEYQQDMPSEYTLQMNGEKLKFTAIPGKEAEGWMEAKIPEKMRENLTKAAENRGPWVFKGRELVREKDAVTTDAFKESNFPVDVTGDSREVPPETIDENRSLLVRDLAIVNDARASGIGAWSFGGVMTRLAAANAVADASKMVEDWLNQWATDQTVKGGDVVKARAKIKDVIASWPKSEDKKLDLAQSPFRLTAIVNRLDLRPKPVPGLEGEAGEGRFVFCLIDPATKEPFRGGDAFLVIFEFGVKFNTRTEVAEYGRKWVELSELEFEQDLFKEKLQALTDKFVTLNQLRTNERRLVAETKGNWELREFRITNDGKGFFTDTVKRTPANRYAAFMNLPADPADPLFADRLEALKKWANDNKAEILADNPRIGETLSVKGVAQPFAGAAAETPDPTSFWILSLLKSPLNANENEIRHHLSLQTCNGCHGGEAHLGFDQTRTAFVHIKERGINERAQISEFLDGIKMPDPGAAAAQPPNDLTRRHNDLARRIKDLSDLLSVLTNNPLPELRRDPLRFVH